MNRIERLLRVVQKPKRNVIGLMSGTSVDAIDAVLAEIEGHASEARAQVLAFQSYPFPPGMRERIFALFRPETAKVDQICYLDFLIGELFAGSGERPAQRLPARCGDGGSGGLGRPDHLARAEAGEGRNGRGVDRPSDPDPFDVGDRSERGDRGANWNHHDR
jgi:hypothetical protein